MLRKVISVFVLLIVVSGGTIFFHDGNAGAYGTWYQKPDSYDQLVSWYKNLEEQYPGYIEVFKANELYGTGKIDGGYDDYYIRITNESRGFHKPEVLFLGGPHGDETAGTVGMYWFADWLMRNVFGGNEWLKWLIDNREIYIVISQNPYGFDHEQRTDMHNWDLNREADYDGPGRYGPPECWGSVNGKTLMEFVDHHMIRVGADFHGGARMLLYPWSSIHSDIMATSPISGKEYSYAPPDFYFYDAECLRLGSYMGNFGGNLDAGNIGTIPTTVGYEAPGSIAAWAYGSDVERNPAEGEYVEKADGYPGSGILWVSPEISVVKNPPGWKMGNDIVPGYGTEVRRFLLHQIDIAQPYVRWISPPDTATDDTVTVKWQVNGSIVVDHTSIQWSTSPDPLENPEFIGNDHDDFNGKYVGGTGWDGADRGSTYGITWSDEIDIPENVSDIYVLAKAQVDQIYANTVAPEVYGGNSYLRLVRERTNGSYHEVINGTDGTEEMNGHIWWYSPVIHIHVGGISRPRDGYLYAGDREITPTLSGKTVIIGKITVGVDSPDADRIEFYVDDVLKSSLTEKPYNWVWDERAVGTHVLKVKMYGEYISEDSIEVVILNPVTGIQK